MLKSIYHISRNLFNEIIGKVRNSVRAYNTQILRKYNKSDLKRWKKDNELQDNWNERTGIIASLMPPDAKIIEFGAGNLKLKELLPEGTVYQASDITQRYPEVVICDLNEGISLNLQKFDTAVFSGVLEYVYDIDQVFKQLKGNINHIILSYACSDISNANRLDRGWLSDYTAVEMERIFARNGYSICDYKEWRNQSIYKLRKEF